jgi:hypothetical protein
MKTINIFTIDNLEGDYCTQIWEYFYAYYQYQSYPNDTDININFLSDKNFNEINFSNDALNIVHFSMNDFKYTLRYDLNKFDVVIFDNMFEHLMVSDPDIIKYVLQHDNAYLSVGSYVSNEHHMFEKFIPFQMDIVNCRDWYTNPKVFSSYSFNHINDKKNNLIYIGAELRSWRKFIIDNLTKNININVHQVPQTVVCTRDTNLGDSYTQNFIEYCNNKYQVTGVEEVENPLYKELIYGHKDRPAGKSLMSAWIIPEFINSKCVVYAESSFVNDEICLTEKTIKCIMTKTHWIFFAGSNAYKLLKEFGLRSVLELIPGGLEFDCIKNPKERFKKQISLIKYLSEHPEIFDTPEAQNIVNSNYEIFISGNQFLTPLFDKLNDILLKHQ